MKRTGKNTRVGFTLVELLVSMTIIMILTVVAMVNYGSAQKNARDAKRKSDLEKSRIGLEMYKQDHNGCYPTHICALQINGPGSCTFRGTVLSHDYLDKVPIADPLGWLYVYEASVPCGTEGDATSYSLRSFMELEKNMTNVAGDNPPLDCLLVPPCPGPSYKTYYTVINP